MFAEKISKSELFHQIVRRVSLSLIHGRSKQVGKSFIPQEFARILEWIYTYLICDFDLCDIKPVKCIKYMTLFKIQNIKNVDY